MLNQGTLTVADGANGGLVALLAPEVRNEGVISARLGNVVLAAGERVTLEAGANGRLRVAVDPATVATLVDNRQMIVADGGQVVMSAQAADRLNSAVVANTGTVQARTLENRAGRILLLADVDHGEAKVGGRLDASAPDGGDGATGGFVETSAATVNIAADARVVTLAANGRHGNWLIDPNDYTVAASGGNISGATLSANLGGGNITISTATQGTAGGNGDVFVNDAVTWSANKLTLNAGRNIGINANLNGSGAASLALEYGQSAVAAGNTADYSLGNGAKVTLPAGANFSTKLGSDGATATYTVITSLGAAGSVTGTDLQGVNGNVAGKYVLGADIDASATAGWNGGAGFAPIGDNSTNDNASRFTGILDGLGHGISGLFISRPVGVYVGLFGLIDGGVIRNVGLVGGSVSGLGGAASGGVGALVGGTLFSATISNSYAMGVNVSGMTAGGLVGELYRGTISNSYATGNVTGNVIGDSGGLVGYSEGSISNSYATGNVSIGGNVGGLVGGNSGTVSYSYATGSVSNGGGLVAVASGGTVSDSYWNTTTSGQATSGGGTGKTMAQMKQQASFAGWDFANTWRIYEGESAPVLRALQANLTVTANNASKTYDGNTYAGGNGVGYSIAGATPGGAPAYGGTAQGAVNPGSYTIVPGGLASDQRYHIAYANGTLTINPAAASSATTTSRQPDGGALARDDKWGSPASGDPSLNPVSV